MEEGFIMQEEVWYELGVFGGARGSVAGVEFIFDGGVLRIFLIVRHPVWVD